MAAGMWFSGFVNRVLQYSLNHSKIADALIARFHDNGHSMQMLTDLLPVILFFVSYKMAGIYTATAVAIATTLLLIVYSKWRFNHVDKMLMINGAIISVLGGITLLLHDKTYIMWKPTVLYWIGALALLISRYALQNNLIEKMFNKIMAPPKAIWDKLNLIWVIFLLLLGVLNLYVAMHYSENTWVNFKLFGVTTLMFAFILAQALILKEHWVAQDESSD
jgi:intracellular septation protein